MVAELSLDNDVFVTFAVWSAIVVLKLMLLGLLTMFRRIQGDVFATPEDVTNFAKDKKRGLVLDDPGVERARRNHLNDLENIPAFVLLGFFYVLTNPSPWLAVMHFRVFGVARISHTISYQLGLQPWRIYSHLVTIGILFSMAIQVIMLGRF